MYYGYYIYSPCDCNYIDVMTINISVGGGVFVYTPTQSAVGEQTILAIRQFTWWFRIYFYHNFQFVHPVKIYKNGMGILQEDNMLA